MNYPIADHNAKLLQKGDPAAFTYFYNKYEKQLRLFAIKLINDPEEAKDIVAETYLKLWSLHDRFGKDTNVKAFLFITVKNNCLNFLRNDTTRNNIRNKIADSNMETLTTKEIDVIDRKNRLNILFAKIGCMSPVYRQTLEYYYFDQLSIPEIARIMHSKEKTVRNNIARATKRLKNDIQKVFSSS